MTDITFSQVQKSFHKKVVLDIPDFQVKSGEIFSIVGGNGAGKSTFIKLLAGIFLQDKGEVRVHGVSNHSKKIHSLVKFVLESGQGLYSYLTAMENLQYFLGLNGIAFSHIKAEVDILCDQLAFTPYKDTLVSELSQGNRQKLTLILALVQKPKVLCLDEPTNGLDLLAKKQLTTLLQDYACYHQASIFITSHDASFIEKVSTRVVLIQEGRLYREGTFEEIFGNVHQHEVYHLLLDKSAESVLRQSFPELDYKVLDDGISVETRNPDLYRILLEETEVLQFTREPASLEDLLYEVLK